MSYERLLIWLIIGIIGITLFSTFMTMLMINDNGITGKATDTGTTTTTLGGSAGITMVDSSIAFGSGYYNASCTQGYADIESATYTKNCWINTTTWLSAEDNHVIRNSGTTLLNVTLDSDKTSGEALFCSGDGGCLSTNTAGVKYKSANSEVDSCNTETTGSYTDVLTYSGEPSSTLLVCNNLNYEDENDEVKVCYEFLVPADATSGEKTLTITYTGTAL
jgi:hypothetical protein